MSLLELTFARQPCHNDEGSAHSRSSRALTRSRTSMCTCQTQSLPIAGRLISMERQLSQKEVSRLPRNVQGSTQGSTCTQSKAFQCHSKARPHWSAENGGPYIRVPYWSVPLEGLYRMESLVEGPENSSGPKLTRKQNLPEGKSPSSEMSPRF